MKEKTIKRKFLNEIDKICKEKQKYVKNPNKDFTWNRKILLKDVVLYDILMTNRSLFGEALDYFGNINIPTTSAIIQQRHKIKTFLYQDLFDKTNKIYKSKNKFDGYNILAVDGSDVRIPTNKDDADTYLLTEKHSKGFKMLHLNAVFNVLDRKFEQITLQGKQTMNENSAMVEMLSKIPNFQKNSIILADRNYESYNNIAFLNENKFKYIIRIKNAGIISKLNVPEKAEFSKDFDTRSAKKEYKHNLEKYRILSHSSKFDFF